VATPVSRERGGVTAASKPQARVKTARSHGRGSSPWSILYGAIIGMVFTHQSLRMLEIDSNTVVISCLPRIVKWGTFSTLAGACYPYATVATDLLLSAWLMFSFGGRYMSARSNRLFNMWNDYESAHLSFPVYSSKTCRKGAQRTSVCRGHGACNLSRSPAMRLFSSFKTPFCNVQNAPTQRSVACGCKQRILPRLQP
jgi:hypothetical protein